MTPSQHRKPKARKHISLLLVEGETEEEFYSALGKLKLNGVPKKIKNLKGNFNINNKILDASLQFSSNNPNDTFDVYVCIDQERIGTPPYNKDFVLSHLKQNANFNSLHDVIATLMIESLFFIDIESIYAFLRAKKTLREKKKFTNFRKLTHHDLSNLFKRFNKTYYKGIRSEGFISSLDIDKISNTANELEYLITNLTTASPRGLTRLTI